MKLPYRILVLDDDENALSGIVELLRDAEYGVSGAVTYEAAKRQLEASSFDLLITDVRLRGFNGLNLVMKCRSDYPDMAVIGLDTCLDNLTKAARKGSPNLRFIVCDAMDAPSWAALPGDFAPGSADGSQL